jgi:hypothetical protein
MPEPFSCWLTGSLFVRDAASDFLVECFSRANPKFDYFTFERFDQVHLHALATELTRFLQTLVPVVSPREAILSTYASLFSRSIWQDVPNESLRIALVGNDQRHRLRSAYGYAAGATVGAWYVTSSFRLLLVIRLQPAHEDGQSCSPA